MRMTFYTANCRGNAKNNLYPNKRVVDNEDDSLEVMAFDHVCGEFKDFRRSGGNFLSSDVEVMDCDNDHSDAPGDWIYPKDLEDLLGADVAFFAVPSRNHMKPKDGKSARPRFHVYFPHDPITDGDACAALKRAIQQKFPFFDAHALDAARFIFGNPTEEIFWHEGEITIDCIVKPQEKGIGCSFFSRKGVRKCRQNPITQAGAAARDLVREEKRLPSRRKPRTAIRADADWKCWIFPKSRVSICQSPMSFYPPSSVTGVRSRRRRYTRKPGSG